MRLIDADALRAKLLERYEAIQETIKEIDAVPTEVRIHSGKEHSEEDIVVMTCSTDYTTAAATWHDGKWRRCDTKEEIDVMFWYPVYVKQYD